MGGGWWEGLQQFGGGKTKMAAHLFAFLKSKAVNSDKSTDPFFCSRNLHNFLPQDWEVGDESCYRYKS